MINIFIIVIYYLGDVLLEWVYKIYYEYKYILLVNKQDKNNIYFSYGMHLPELLSAIISFEHDRL